MFLVPKLHLKIRLAEISPGFAPAQRDVKAVIFEALFLSDCNLVISLLHKQRFSIVFLGGKIHLALESRRDNYLFSILHFHYIYSENVIKHRLSFHCGDSLF